MAENLPWHKVEHISLYKCFTSVPVPFLDKLTLCNFYSKPQKRGPSTVETCCILEKITSME